MGAPTKEQAAAGSTGQYQKGAAVMTAAMGGAIDPLSPGATDAWGRRKDTEEARDIKTYQLQYHLQMQFPMYVLPVSTLLGHDRMYNFEECMAKGEIKEWDGQSPVFFLSHQWTAFNEPDHSRTQLRTIQAVLAQMQAGTFDQCFAAPQEWNHFKTKDPIGVMSDVFAGITAEGMQEEAKVGYVWLDYSCVPQAPGAQDERLKAIESIPHYIDAATTFVALCPPIEHKELKYTCDYHSWRHRGWCRLEEQVSELKLFSFADVPLPQFGPHAKVWDIPRRPFVVHGESHITCVDMFDHFYMLGQRSYSVFNGTFACCSLNHKKTFDDGTVLELPCDKDRIKPFCSQMWQRKSNHFYAGSPMVRHMYAWRWISHMKLMMAETPADTSANNDDPALKTLDDICRKYYFYDPEWLDIMNMMSMFPLGLIDNMIQKHGDMGQFGGKTSEPGQPLSLEDNKAELAGRAQRLQAALAQEKPKCYVNHALGMVIAEGNLAMVKMLVEEHGADVTLGMSWGMITFVDFAAGKGHTRVLRYLLDNGAMCDLNRQSSMQLIGAVDRACKAGHLECLEVLLEKGAKPDTRRRNGESPAHGAAINGHVHVLKELKRLGLDLHLESREGKTPLDLAKYYRQSETCAFLEADARGELPSEREQAAVSAALLRADASKQACHCSWWPF